MLEEIGGMERVEEAQETLKDIQFVNLENVCKAEREILHNILQGADSREYSRGLFAFVTPFNEGRKGGSCEEGSGDSSSIDGQFDNNKVDEEEEDQNEELHDDVDDSSDIPQNHEISGGGSGPQIEMTMPNGPVLTLPPPHETLVSQTNPHHPIPAPAGYYATQGHLPVAVSATSAPISSVGQAPITPMENSTPGNPQPMLMFAPGMPMIPQQPFYPAHAYYPPPGGYVPVDGSMSETYLTQNHHNKGHDSHHRSHNNSGGSGGNYGKGRRKQQQQQQPPAPQYYQYPQYYQVPQYYNQQQLQNVTGPPIIMAPPGMYLQHPQMYNPVPPQGAELDPHHGSLSSQSMIGIPNDMTFAQIPHPVSQAQAYSSYTNPPLRGYSNPLWRPPGVSTSVPHPNHQPSDQTQALVDEEVQVVDEKSSPSATSSSDASHHRPKSQAETPKSLPDLSSSNGTIVSTPEKDCSIDKHSHTSPASSSETPVVVNGTNSPSTWDEKDVKGPTKDSSSPEKKEEVIVKGKKSATCVTKPQTAPTLVNGDCGGGDREPQQLQPSSSSSPDSSASQSQIQISDSLSADQLCDKELDHHYTSTSSSTRSPVPKPKSYNSVTKNNSSSSIASRSADVVETSPTATAAATTEDCKPTESTTNPCSSSDPPKMSAISTTVVEVEASKSTAPAVARSWASIASVKSQNIPNDGAIIARQGHALQQSSSTTFNNEEDTSSSIFVPSSGFDMGDYHDDVDPVSYRLGEHLTKYQLDHQSIPLAPRGLQNHSNSCFLNATLQALLACPPFVNAFRAMILLLDKSPCKTAPVTQNVFEFIREFTPLIRHNVNSNSVKKEKARDSFIPGPNLEPSGIRKSLALLSKDTTFKIEGRQEDAEEFLSFLLNSLHEEMIKVMKLPESKKAAIKGTETTPTPSPTATVNGSTETYEEEDDDQWQVMGAKNKSCLTRRTAITKSPISEAFLGQMCLSLSQVNSVKKAHLQPFFTLPLAIQNENIKSVKDALDAISIREEVSGMTSPSGGEIEAWRQVSLEDLPPILILQLKRFIFEKNTNGIHKINKKLEYTVDLEIGKELLSTSGKSKYTPKQRQYKLFAVVYHDGEDAHKGHYVADCFHPSGGTTGGQWGWLRYDDTSVKPISEANMLNPLPPRVPYLLLYRRQDTITLQQQNKK